MTPDRSRGRALAAVALVLGFVTFGAITILRALEPGPARGPDPDPPARLDLPAHLLPAAVPAAQADLPADEPVIGVWVAGRARAYRVSLFEGRENHVVSDRVGGRPVAVTHCDRTGCTRVFTGGGSDLLDVRTGGYHDGLILTAAGRRYWQDTGAAVDPGVAVPFPYAAVEFVRTTWAEWRAAHPDTDVVTDLSRGAAAGN